MGGNRSRLGRWGEELVAKHLGFTRVPFSGGVWPFLQDLVKTVRRGTASNRSYAKDLAQVKTTEGDDWLKSWQQLEKHAAVEGARPRWFYVVKQPNEVYIFETVLVKKVRTGVGGDDA